MLLVEHMKTRHLEALNLAARIAAIFLIYHIFNRVFSKVGKIEPLFLCLFVFASVFVAYRTRTITYEDTCPAFRILLRGVVAILTFYTAVAYIILPADTPWLVAAVPEFSRSLAIAGGVIAFWIPVFALVPAIHILASKRWGAERVDIPYSAPTDYLPVVECAIFLTLGLLILTYAQPVLARLRLSKYYVHLEKGDFTKLLFICAVGIHFGNYFYSAVAKFALEGGPLVWAIENPTAILSLVAQEGHFMPIGQWPVLAEYAQTYFASVVVAANIATLVGQTLSVIFLRDIRYTIWLTLFYDLTHIAIYLLTGIFFWKWILLNAVIVIAATSIRDLPLNRFERSAGTFCVLLGTTVFFAAQLGWYDTGAFNRAWFSAETSDGRLIEVPSNYFMTSSLTVARMRLGAPERAGHLPSGSWGTTNKVDFMRRAKTCSFEDRQLQARRIMNRDQVERMVRLHHRAILDHADENGLFPYDFYPHHIWSNPLEFKEFAQLDNRKIVAFHYNFESVCITYNEGKREKRVLHRSSHVIDVSQP